MFSSFVRFASAIALFHLFLLFLMNYYADAFEPLKPKEMLEMANTEEIVGFAKKLIAAQVSGYQANNFAGQQFEKINEGALTAANSVIPTDSITKNEEILDEKNEKLAKELKPILRQIQKLEGDFKGQKRLEDYHREKENKFVAIMKNQKPQYFLDKKQDWHQVHVAANGNAAGQTAIQGKIDGLKKDAAKYKPEIFETIKQGQIEFDKRVEANNEHNILLYGI